MLERLRLSAALVEDGNSIPKVDVRQLITNSNGSDTPSGLLGHRYTLITRSYEHTHIDIVKTSVVYVMG